MKTLFIIILIYTLLLSLIMVGCGLIFIKFPPKTINGVIGYRTRMSCLNQDTWDFAHNYSGKIWIILGIINLVINVILTLVLMNSEVLNKAGQFIIYYQLVILILVIPITEVKLYKKINKDGSRKNL